MGDRASSALAREQSATQMGEATIRHAEERRLDTERNLAMQEQLLGTEEQVAGTLGGPSPETLPYLGRYQFDEAMLSAYEQAPGGVGITQLLSGNTERANALMEQAQAAAESGDLKAAEDFRGQADNMLLNKENRTYYGQELGAAWGLFPVMNVEELRGAFSFVESPESRAKSRLGSPMAQTVGGLVQKGRQFLDPNSKESRQFKNTLTEGGERAIASESRAAQRQQRDLALGSGAARSVGREASIAQRGAETFAATRATMRQQANQYFQEFSLNFAKDSVHFAQAWLQGQSDIREQFQGALDALATTQASLANFSAERNSADYLQQRAADSAKKAAKRSSTLSIATSVIGMAAGAALAPFTGGASLALTAAAAGSAGTNA